MVNFQHRQDRGYTVKDFTPPRSTQGHPGKGQDTALKGQCACRAQSSETVVTGKCKLCENSITSSVKLSICLFSKGTQLPSDKPDSKGKNQTLKRKWMHKIKVNGFRCSNREILIGCEGSTQNTTVLF